MTEEEAKAELDVLCSLTSYTYQVRLLDWRQTFGDTHRIAFYPHDSSLAMCYTKYTRSDLLYRTALEDFKKHIKEETK